MSHFCNIANIVLDYLIGGLFIYSFSVTGRRFELLLGGLWVLVGVFQTIPKILDRHEKK